MSQFLLQFHNLQNQQTPILTLHLLPHHFSLKAHHTRQTPHLSPPSSSRSIPHNSMQIQRLGWVSSVSVLSTYITSMFYHDHKSEKGSLIDAPMEYYGLYLLTLEFTWLIMCFSSTSNWVRVIKVLYLYHNWPTWYQFLTATFCHANW
ncbi:hypothetical protein DVH24_020874 [Malus domestica]|uniref:Uncharacterized protein n=1 Tax=Malus domestica TaxID=3750 RepID=A0A498JER6_MALDO|nr:hypothetical protein DVH24_020874 [Malus domestica]